MEAVTAINTPPPSPERSLWSSLWEAIRGSHQDYTTGNLNRAILLLAVPMVLEMVLESLFAVVDVFWVGRLGANAVATVGLTESLLSLVFAVGIGLSLSTTAMVARRIGEKDPTGAAVAGVQAILLGLATSVAVGIPCFIYAPQLLRLMGASSDIVSMGSGYARIALGGSGAILMLFLNNAIFRGAGDAAIAMRLLWVSNIINLILDPCLIFGLGPFPRLGVTGAALATFTGRSIGVAYQFYRLLRGTERIRILAGQIRVNLHVLLRLVRVSLTGILQFAIAHTSWIGLVRIVSVFGAAALAGYTIAIRIVAHRLLQHAFPRIGGSALYPQGRADRAPVHPGPGRRSAGRDLSAHRQLRQHRLRLRHGHDAGFQWRRRHSHAHHRKFLRLLALGNPAGVLAGGSDALALQRRVHRNRHRGMLHRRRQRRAVQEREVEDAEDLKGLRTALRLL